MKKNLFISTSLSVVTLLTCLSFAPTSIVKADTINSKTTLSTQSSIARVYDGTTAPGYINGYNVNIRKGPGTNTKVICMLNKGQIVEVTDWEYSSDWIQIKNPCGSGFAYVYYKYVISK